MFKLDETQDAFRQNPSAKTAGTYLMTALQYWHDEMLSDAAFGEECVAEVARYLTTQNP